MFILIINICQLMPLFIVSIVFFYFIFAGLILTFPYMIIGISLLVIGIFLGYFLRNRSRILWVSSKLTDGAIFLLLFFLGVTVGMNDKIISNFQNLGLQSLIITLFATIGSLGVTYIFYKIFFSKR